MIKSAPQARFLASSEIEDAAYEGAQLPARRIIHSTGPSSSRTVQCAGAARPIFFIIIFFFCFTCEAVDAGRLLAHLRLVLYTSPRPIHRRPETKTQTHRRLFARSKQKATMADGHASAATDNGDDGGAPRRCAGSGAYGYPLSTKNPMAKREREREREGKTRRAPALLVTHLACPVSLHSVCESHTTSRTLNRLLYRRRQPPSRRPVGQNRHPLRRPAARPLPHVGARARR